MKRLLFVGIFIGILAGGVFLLSKLLASNKTLMSLLPQTAPNPTLTKEPYVVYGYLPYWTVDSASLPKELTQVAFFSLGIHANGHLLNIPSAQQDNGYRAVQRGVLESLRQQANGTPVELVISMMDQDAIKTFITDSNAQQQFLLDLSTLTASHHVDGINIDVEYNGEVTNTTRDNFTSLIAQVRQQHPTLHLSVATYADAATTLRITDPKGLAQVVDHLIVMTYDFHKRSSLRSGPVAPLYGGKEKWDSDISAVMKAYTDQVPSRKILLGIPFYGYEWSVTNAQDPQAFTIPKSGSTATYERINNLIKTGKTQLGWDPEALSPYLHYQDNGKDQIIYYENADSLSYKLDLVKQANLGGIAIWALGYEGTTNEYWRVINQKLIGL